MNEEATMKPDFSASVSGAPGFLRKLLAFILSVALFGLAFMFSLAALAVVAVAGMLFAGWFWWKTRALRRQMREQGMPGEMSTGGHIIEGEVIRDDEEPPTGGRRLR